MEKRNAMLESTLRKAASLERRLQNKRHGQACIFGISCVPEAVEQLLALFEKVAELVDHLSLVLLDLADVSHPALLVVYLAGDIVERTPRIITVHGLKSTDGGDWLSLVDIHLHLSLQAERTGVCSRQVLQLITHTRSKGRETRNGDGD